MEKGDMLNGQTALKAHVMVASLVPSLSNGAGCHVLNNWPPLLEGTLGKHPQITSACPEIEMRFSESVDVTTFFVVPEKENMGRGQGLAGLDASVPVYMRSVCVRGSGSGTVVKEVGSGNVARVLSGFVSR